jgi:hypothetical protein
MDKLTFYEQVGIVIPGSVLLAGLLFFFPALNTLVPKDGITLGQFGIFLLLSYAAGHLVAAVGNVLEPVWKLVGGMPTDWVTREKGNSLLNTDQVKKLADKVRSRLGIAVENVAGYDARKWYPISRQIYADVAKNGKSQRIDTFNGNYGLNRGLCASTLLLALASSVEGQKLIGAALIIAALIYGYRAYRFGVYYGRELYLQFLVMEDAPPPK